MLELERTWQDALVDATVISFQGHQGHLATITSQAEHDFLLAEFGQIGWLWMGASDRAVEGEWRWMAGPEAGELFWLGDASGRAATYAAWTENEANNLGSETEGEGFAMFNWLHAGWNDLPTHTSQDYLICGPLVEFSVPEPTSLAMLGTGMALFIVRVRRFSSKAN